MIRVCNICIEQLAMVDSSRARALRDSNVQIISGCGTDVHCYFCGKSFLAINEYSLKEDFPIIWNCNMCGLPVRIPHLRPEHCTVTIGQAVMSLFRWGTIAKINRGR